MVGKDGTGKGQRTSKGLKCFHRNLTGSEYNRSLLGGGEWALMDFQCVLEFYVKVRNCSSLAIY